MNASSHPSGWRCVVPGMQRARDRRDVAETRRRARFASRSSTNRRNWRSGLLAEAPQQRELSIEELPRLARFHAPSPRIRRIQRGKDFARTPSRERVEPLSITAAPCRAFLEVERDAAPCSRDLIRKISVVRFQLLDDGS
jgi:hypothetical protein